MSERKGRTRERAATMLDANEVRRLTGSGRGFASMSQERRRECARAGYEAAVELYGRKFAFANLAKGRRFTSETGKAASVKGNAARSATPQPGEAQEGRA